MRLIGDQAPEFKATTTYGEINFPNDKRFENKWIVLFSHPADFTPFCTTEFMAFHVVEERSVVMSANWPINDFLGAKVIVPPDKEW